jgi:hypothetical protein
MVFGKPTDSERTRVLGLMVKEVEHYEKRHPGDRYLLAGWSDEGDGSMGSGPPKRLQPS